MKEEPDLCWSRTWLDSTFLQWKNNVFSFHILQLSSTGNEVTFSRDGTTNAF